MDRHGTSAPGAGHWVPYGPPAPKVLGLSTRSFKICRTLFWACLRQGANLGCHYHMHAGSLRRSSCPRRTLARRFAARTITGTITGPSGKEGCGGLAGTGGAVLAALDLCVCGGTGRIPQNASLPGGAGNAYDPGSEWRPCLARCWHGKEFRQALFHRRTGVVLRGVPNPPPNHAAMAPSTRATKPKMPAREAFRRATSAARDACCLA